MRKTLLIAMGLAAAAIVALDQAVKAWAKTALPGQDRPLLPGLVKLTYTENRGASFGILQNQQWLFVIITAVALTAMVWLLFSQRVTHPLGRWSLTAVLGGAVGNFVDRLFHGFVVDMFEFEFFHFAIFNVADIFISLGGVSLLIYLLFLYHKEGQDAA